jgi:DNA-directed RNA polymerase specialized sigma24 family protein
LDEIREPVAPDSPTEEAEQKEHRLSCLDECLDKLPIESSRLILGYYDDEEKAKIARRKLAEALGIPLNALRIRAHRIRTVLEECLQQCLAVAK